MWLCLFFFVLLLIEMNDNVLIITTHAKQNIFTFVKISEHMEE